MLEPITITIPEAKRLSGLGHTKIYELIGNGTIKSKKIGRRRILDYGSFKQALLPHDQDAA